MFSSFFSQRLSRQRCAIRGFAVPPAMDPQSLLEDGGSLEAAQDCL